MVEGTATTTVACLATVRLYLWETVVAPRGFSNVATLWPSAQCFTLVSGWLIGRKPPFIKPEDSLPCSQESTIDPYHDLNQGFSNFSAGVPPYVI
jgi:hypothetical protein